MGGGGGTQRTVTETQPSVRPGLDQAYNEFGSMATQFMQNFGPQLFGLINDQRPQQIAGPTELQNEAYRTQAGLLGGQGPAAWQDALGMFSNLGNLPQWQGANLSGITGWGQQPTQNPFGTSPPPLEPSGRVSAQSSGMQAGRKEAEGADGLPRNPWGFTPTTDYTSLISAGIDPTGPSGPALAGTPVAPQGSNATPYTRANPNAGGVNAPGMGQASGSGTVREIDLSKYGGGGGGGGGWNFSSSSGGGGGVEELERIGNPLENIDFANHPALRSALKTFAKTTQPGIENAMIGAGLGRSGAAGNAIETGQAAIALPVMQQLIEGELANKGFDVTQRGQDTQARIAANAAAAQARAQGASLQQQMAMARLAAEQTMRGQDIQLRGQDINALLAQGDQALSARGMDINALLGGAQGLFNMGSADIDRINTNIGNSWGLGESARGIQNDIYTSEFNAQNRPYERIMSFMSPLVGGAVGSTGTTSRSTQSGGGK